MSEGNGHTNITNAAALTAAAAAIATAVFVQSNSMSKSTKESAAPATDLNYPPEGFSTGYFVNRRSQTIRTLSLDRSDGSIPPTALAVFFHGVNDHSGRDMYIQLFRRLSDGGADVRAMDHHGHGRSDGEPRRYCDSFDHYLDDCEDFVKRCRDEEGHEGVPLIVMGQSLGALMSALLTLRIGSDAVSGLVMTSPACGVDYNLEQRIQLAVSPIINTLIPKACIVDAVRPEDLTRSKEGVEAYKADPLIGKGKLPARTGIESVRAFDLLKDGRGDLTSPLLIVHGTVDKTTSISKSLEFFNNVGTPMEKKAYLRMLGFYHEAYHEPGNKRVIDAIVDFVTSGGTKLPERSAKDSVRELDGTEDDDSK